MLTVGHFCRCGCWGVLTVGPFCRYGCLGVLTGVGFRLLCQLICTSVGFHSAHPNVSSFC